MGLGTLLTGTYQFGPPLSEDAEDAEDAEDEDAEDAEDAEEREYDARVRAMGQELINMHDDEFDYWR